MKVNTSHQAGIGVVHPTGNQNVRALLAGLEERGCLEAFVTSLAWKDSWMTGLLPESALRTLRRRSYGITASKIFRVPLGEVARLLSVRLGLRSLIDHDDAPFSTFSVYKTVDARMARMIRRSKTMKLVYGYDDGALLSFQSAVDCGVRRVYECPTAHWKTWNAIYDEERDLQPEWAATIGYSEISAEKRDRKEAEFELAERIICASSFARRSIVTALGDKKDMHVIPYGAPTPVSKAALLARPRSQKLRVLYVGGITQKKGLSYLNEAINQAGADIELTLVGRTGGADCPAMKRFIGKHRWHPSLPHGEVLSLMRGQDVLVLPTLSDGFGLVILEAMAQGMVVIATENSGGPDVITHGVDGYIVPIRNAALIARFLQDLAKDRDKLLEMALAARATAEKYSWSNYAGHVFSAIADLARPAAAPLSRESPT